MNNSSKYQRNYFLPEENCFDWVKKEYIETSPIWCSVDLRDGNQALIEPMSQEEKLEFFKLLVEVGFKEIEVGFPAASETEYSFIRELIERNLIPDDVTIQVLTQARKHIIERTFSALRGVKNAIVHVYNSTSYAQRTQVFKKEKEEIKKIAIEGARLLKEYAEKTEGNFRFEYSPESFTGTEPEYALEVINAVIEEWKPTKDKKVIINLPATVELSLPHIFASQVEYINKNIIDRGNIILSLHPHNDRGTGVAIAELGLLAGADRMEGTLFGNGERTGNVDIVTLALNMYSHGVEPNLEFHNIARIKEVYERLTKMEVSPRHPYVGELVFTAFSGSHQDAISKGFVHRERNSEERWNVPYLPIDPVDLGREYAADVIRINSQSGKGGISYIIKTNYGIDIPQAMREEVGYTVKDISDKEHSELTPSRIYAIFEGKYVNNNSVFSIVDVEFSKKKEFLATVTISHRGIYNVIKATGNGSLDAASNALKQYFDIEYELTDYEEYALTKGSKAKAITFVSISFEGKKYWGVGLDEDIIKASIMALASAINRIEIVKLAKNKEERLNTILNIIQETQGKITLVELSNRLYLSKQYLSKYIKEKTGFSFAKHIRKIRLKRAASLLLDEKMKIEVVSKKVGYRNVEHFIRIFKEEYGTTPSRYRDTIIK